MASSSEHTSERPNNPTRDNIRTIIELERRAVRGQTLSERISGGISRIAGSLSFVAAHLVLFAGWAIWNSTAPERWRFDPYPYGLLTFFVSLEGVLVATFVLITQNLMSRQTIARDHLNLQIDLLAEQEMTVMLRMLRRLSDHVGVPPDDRDNERTERLTEETNVYELMGTLRREIRHQDTPTPGL